MSVAHHGGGTKGSYSSVTVSGNLGKFLVLAPVTRRTPGILFFGSRHVENYGKYIFQFSSRGELRKNLFFPSRHAENPKNFIFWLSPRGELGEILFPASRHTEWTKIILYALVTLLASWRTRLEAIDQFLPQVVSNFFLITQTEFLKLKF